MSLFKKVTDYAKSEQGKKVINQAKNYAQDPKNRQKVDRIAKRVFGRGGGGR